MVTFSTVGELLRMAESDLAKPWSAFLLSGAGSEETLYRNRRALNRLAIEQLLLDDRREITVRQRFFGLDLASPIIVAPMGMVQLLSPDGDIEMVRGASQVGCLATVANEYRNSPSAIAKTSSGPLLAQLRAATDPAAQQAKLDELHACPNYEGVCVTVDGPVETRIDHYIEAGPGQYKSDIPGTVVPGHRFSWKHIDRIRTMTKLPMGLKGVMSARDARSALDHGADFIWVSNHGARKMDSVRATIDVLDEVAVAVDGRVPIIVDSGFQRGSDIVKALARGATLVAVGKLAACALGLDGAAGVSKLLMILNAELKNALACSGNSSIEQLNREVLVSVDY